MYYAQEKLISLVVLILSTSSVHATHYRLMRTLLNQIEQSLSAGFYYLSLMTALSIPDIAGALRQTARPLAKNMLNGLRIGFGRDSPRMFGWS